MGAAPEEGRCSVATKEGPGVFTTCVVYGHAWSEQWVPLYLLAAGEPGVACIGGDDVVPVGAP